MLPLPAYTTRMQFALAALAGLLFSAAFPSFEIAGAAWIAPGLLAGVAGGASRGHAFRLGYVAGLVHALTSLYWLLNIPVAWSPILGWLCLAAYLALYLGIWTWLVTFVGASVPRGKLARVGWPLLGAALWVVLEWFRCWFLSGFPWNPLGVSQFRLVPLIQIAALTGVWGVSFLVVWGSLGLAQACRRLLEEPGNRWAWAAELALPGTAVIAAFVLGNHRLNQPLPTAGQLRVACVQPSIPQTMIWDPRETTNRFAQLMDLSRRAVATKPDLLVWPEAALPDLDLASFSAITNLMVSGRVWMIFGADDVIRRKDSTGASGADYFNAAFLFDPEGRFVETYHKRKLVIFGEYVPLLRFLPFLKYVTPIEGGFTPGRRAGTFTLGNPRVRLCPLICFEDVFPDLVRRSVNDDTDLLINLTNNGWFGEGAAQWQHSAAALFRAVENDLPLLRSTNNGLTCWVDSRGRIRQVFHDVRESPYGPGVFEAAIPLPSLAERTPTFYHRHGDWLVRLCAVVSALGLGGAWYLRRRLNAGSPG